MLFNSLDFIIFFTVVVLLYYLVPKAWQWKLILASSLIFYMSWRPELIFLLLGVIVINYAVAIAIEAAEEKKAKKRLLCFALILDFGILAVFKYLMFISESFGFLYSLLGREYPVKSFTIILPAGISFYTFQGAGYIIDIYRGDYKSEKSFWRFAAFMSFFPQITAGPIERGSHMLNQMFVPKSLKAENISMGAKVMIWGYFKKLVIADRLSVLVNTVYGSPRDFQGPGLIIATLCFTVQIYCDFSGYSDIARGCARVMGIDLINNFERPYFSASIKEFWRRWHISLSSWFKDYLYIPLGGNRVGVLRHWLNYMLTFMASGLWHGASWTYVVWGGIHGFYQVIGNIRYRIFGRPKRRFFAFDFISALITFCLVAFGWIFFKAETIGDGIYIASHLLENIRGFADIGYMYVLLNSMGLSLFEIALCAGAVLYLFFAEAISFKYEINTLISKAPFVIRFCFYYAVVVMIIAMGVFSSGGEFIYFQF